MARWGIFGGTFDPPHHGHVFIARQAIQALGLDRLLIVPTSANPLKTQPASPAGHRRALAQMLVDLVVGSELDAAELGNEGPAYTIDYLRRFVAERPGIRPALIVGMDAWAGFAQWRQAAAILGLADVAVFRRGEKPSPEALLNPVQNLEGLGPVCYHQDQNAADGHWSWPGGAGRKQSTHLWLLPGTPPLISSTDVRRQVASRQAIDASVPEAIVRYIQQHHLYQSAI